MRLIIVTIDILLPKLMAIFATVDFNIRLSLIFQWQQEKNVYMAEKYNSPNLIFLDNIFISLRKILNM